MCFIKVKEYAKNTLHIVKTAFINKKKTLNEVLLISSYFDELKATLRTNDFLIFLIIHDRTLALENTIIYYFEYTYYNHHRFFTDEYIFTNLDSQLFLF
jgi:hypothetical protein